MKKSIFIFLLCVVLVFSACEQPQPPQYDFVSENVTYSEPNGVYAFIKDMFCLNADGVSYSFEKTISSDDRIDCIMQTQRILDKIRFNKDIHIYVYSIESYSDTYIKDGNIFICEQAWDSPQYISSVLMGLFGEYCNYGLVYGYANYLSSLLDDERMEEVNFDWDENSDPALLDLNLLCFRTPFTSQENIAKVQSIATAFVADYIDTHGIDKFYDLLVYSGDIGLSDKFCEELSLFYSQNGIRYTPSGIQYTWGGHAYDYIVRGEYATFCVERNWQDEMDDLNPLTYDGFLHKDYHDVKEFFETNTRQMSQYQALFNFDRYNNDLFVYFTNSKQSSQNSYYQVQTHSIFLKNVDSLMHEYIHSITLDQIQNKTNWNTEGVARYFSYKYDLYGVAMLNVDYNQPSDSKELLYVREYKENIGRDIDMAIDYREIENIAVYSRDLFDPNKSYVSGSSFVGYLVDQLGEQEAIDLIFSEDGLKGSLYMDLLQDWSLFIKGKYTDYSKYK